MAAAGDKRYLVCAAVAAAVVSMSNRCSLGVLQRVVVHVCVVVGCFGICARTSTTLYYKVCTNASFYTKTFL